MVFNKRDLAKAFSPNKVKRFAKRRSAGNGPKPSTSGSTASSIQGGGSSQTSIKVIVRVRPHNDRELQCNSRTVLKIVDDKMLIFDPKQEENPFFYQGVIQKGRDLLKKQNKELQFIFDKIFDTSSANNDVFEGSTKDLIGSLLEGYNCSVFAYGATGAGKTHTMLGSISDPGITYRTVAELFNQIEDQSEHREFNLGVTYLEIYNENVQDLLHKSGPLHLRDDGRCGIIVAGLKIIPIQNAEELLTLLAKGNKNRTQHPTDANEESSRSHAVFQVYINITNKLDAQVKQVKLSMIDLAGSERASVTGCKGARFKEGANINKSLLALGNCINNLADGIRHIPYRDSKLTRLLKDSLGGNCHTVMIANVSPSSTNYEDTYNTLRYANRAKKIKTNVKKNIISCEMHVTAYIKMVEEQKKEINFLKQKILAFECGAMQIPLEPKENKPNEDTDKYIIEITNKLLELFNKKKCLNEKILSLESAIKILCCRIQYKKAADKRLHNLTTAVDITPEEQNASGKFRLNKSLHYFKRQRDSLKIQIEAAWDELCTVENEMQKLNAEIKAKDLGKKLKDTFSLRTCETEKSNLQQQFEHVKKISSLQQCEMQSLYTMIKMMSTTLQNYYNMMRGYGTMTEKMKQEFKQLIKLLEGVRNIKWSDLESGNNAEDFYNLTCLSVSMLMDPLNSDIPTCTMLHVDEEELELQPVTTNILSTTFDAPYQETENSTDTDVHNTTVTLNEDLHTISSNQQDNAINNANMGEDLNNTFSLPEKMKKRVLSDKNNGNSRTPVKQTKKISPKQRGIFHTATVTGKENTQRSVMSTKSAAILNKLKSDKLKVLPPISKEVCDNEVMDGTLKAVRGKERRGLMSTHPYQKPNVKSKFVPAPPSTRIPW